jgi:demethylmenaquinone methyltransferase/2-methoxy-6-polyprenyl-1,4-benzoquinol methylase
MFDRIAGLYDRMNTVMTAGLHHEWRRRATDLAELPPRGRALDVATGTGDLALELAARAGAGGEVVGVDFSERMLEIARAKADARVASLGGAGVRFETGNALELAYPDGEFDAATVGFGARNFSDLGRGLSEMARVVRPGGRVVVLEITTPRRGPLSLFYRLWFDRTVPALGRLAGSTASWLSASAGCSRAQDAGAEPTIADAYTYLPTSVKRFPGPAALAAEMERTGLHEISCLITAGGIIAIHAGTVRSDPA